MENLQNNFADEKFSLRGSSLFPVENSIPLSNEHESCALKRKKLLLVDALQGRKKRSHRNISNDLAMVMPTYEGIFSSASYLLNGFESD